MDQSNRKVSKGGISGVVAIVAFCLLILLILGLNQNYQSTHYQQGTYIQEVDCSGLTVDEAKEKIEGREIVLIFSNAKTYKATAKELGATINNLSELEGFLEAQQEDKEDKSFMLSEKSWSVDGAELKNFLEGLSELKKEKMRKPTNARLEFLETGTVQIISEVEGNYIEFEDACNFAASALKQSASFIDFEEAMRVTPDITSTDSNLTAEANKLNKILGTKITLELERGETCTLCYESVIKDWVKVENDQITIDIDGNLRKFVEGLDSRVYELGEIFEFETPDGEFVSVPVKEGDRNRVDIEAEIAQLKSELERGENISRKPIYSHQNKIDLNGDFILTSLEAQWVKYYKEGKLLMEGPCVTGTKDTSRATPRGLFYVEYKQTPKIFRTYGGKSKYWVYLKDSNGIGYHDAPWRVDTPTYTEYLPETYITDGSHGCINIQEYVMEIIFENILEGTASVIY